MSRNNRKKNNKYLSKAIMVLSVLLIALFFYFTSWSSGKISLSCPGDVPVVANTNPRVEVRADGTMMVNGKSFFPFGFYHVSLGSAAGKEINTLRTIAAVGFNTFHTSVENSLADYEEILDEAEKLGVYILSFNHSKFDTLKIVNNFKNKAAILGWSIADDVDSGEFTPEQVLHLHCEVKTADPNHITYISGYHDKQISKFIKTADAIGVQAYPIGHQPKRPLSWVNHMISLVYRLVPKNRLIIANPQSFRWYHEKAILPTFEEIRNMTYQALLAGAKGIIYYTYQDEAWNLMEHPELWKQIQSLVPEINEIKSLILDGNLTNLSTDSENLFAGIWVERKEAIVAVLNTSYDNHFEVSIPLPLQSVGEARPIFNGHAYGMVIKEGKLSGSIAPLDVHIYRLSL
jgi:hypothetical protein